MYKIGLKRKQLLSCVCIKLCGEHISLLDLMESVDDVFEGDLDLSALPIWGNRESLLVMGDLDLNSCTELPCLPDKLIVIGSLNLANTTVKDLPENLIVGGDLLLYESKIKNISNTVKVGGKIMVNCISNIECPPEMKHKLRVSE